MLTPRLLSSRRTRTPPQETDNRSPLRREGSGSAAPPTPQGNRTGAPAPGVSSTAGELSDDAAWLRDRRLLNEMLERAGGGVREIVCTAGGATRSESVRCGLSATPAEAEVIVVHDAARPLASASLYAEVAAAVRAGADGAAPAVAVTDTIRHLREGVLDRSELRAVQTPQAFRAQALRDAHHDSGEATDDAGLVEAAGGAVWLVEGDPANIKVTTAVDLAAAEALLRSGLGRPGLKNG